MQTLTKREQEILKLVVSEKSSEEISITLQISIRTVETHRKNIARKIGSSSLVAFTKYAFQQQIIPLHNSKLH